MITMNIKPVKFIICGRTASGKSLFAKILNKKYGMKIAESYTTRPARHENEKGHIFIDKTLADNIPANQKLFRTEYNNCEYFMTKEIVENSDIFILDPKGVIEMITEFPEQPFRIIYMNNPDELSRKIDFINRCDKNPVTADGLFVRRHVEEDGLFLAFDDVFIKRTKTFSDDIISSSNVYLSMIITNYHKQQDITAGYEEPDLSDENTLDEICRCFENFDREIYAQYKCSKRTCRMLDYIIKYDADHPALLYDTCGVNYNHKNNTVEIYRKNKFYDETDANSEEYVSESVSPSVFAELLCCGQDTDGIGRITMAYLRIADKTGLD